MLQKPLSSNDNKWPGTWTIYLFMRIRWLVWPYTEHYQHTCTYTYTQTQLVGSREANKVVFMTIRWLRPLILSRGDTRPIEGHPAFMPCLDNQPSSQAEQMQYTQGHKRGAPAKLYNIKDIQSICHHRWWRRLFPPNFIQLLLYDIKKCNCRHYLILKTFQSPCIWYKLFF